MQRGAAAVSKKKKKKGGQFFFRKRKGGQRKLSLSLSLSLASRELKTPIARQKGNKDEKKHRMKGKKVQEGASNARGQGFPFFLSLCFVYFRFFVRSLAFWSLARRFFQSPFLLLQTTFSLHRRRKET